MTATDTPRKRRAPSVYDAVAGRLGYEGFLPQSRQTSKYRDTGNNSFAPVPPEEILARRKGAPIRYEEDDCFNNADRNLGPHQRLPDSDLLKAIHVYTAAFYHSVTSPDSVSFGSLDETALLALGILLEESASAGLGRSGDLALVELSEQDSRSPSGIGECFSGGKRRRHVVQDAAAGRRSHHKH